MKKLHELILHYQDDKSDKVYIFEIFIQSDFYFILASWGRRMVSSLSSQLKGRYANLNQATNEMNRLANRKRKKGYKKAAISLQIPGHTSDDAVSNLGGVQTSSTVVLEAKGDTELGVDQFGNMYRDLS